MSFLTSLVSLLWDMPLLKVSGMVRLDETDRGKAKTFEIEDFKG